MKKLITLLMAMLMVISLCACGANDQPVETPSDVTNDTVVNTPIVDEPIVEEPEVPVVTEIVVGETYSIEDRFDFEVVKIETIQEIINPNQSHFADDVNGESIIHLTLNVKPYENIDDTLNIADAVVTTNTDETIEYERYYIVFGEGYEEFSNYRDLIAGEDNSVHVFLSCVDDDATDINIMLNMVTTDEDVTVPFTIDYTLNTVVGE